MRTAIDLFEACDPISEEELAKIEIDNKYAVRFKHNKEREELDRLAELKKRGLAPSSDDDSSDSDFSEDLDGGAVEKDLKFYDNLLKVKNGDPILTQKDAKLFDDDDNDLRENPRSKNKKKEKPLYMKEVNAISVMDRAIETEDGDVQVIEEGVDDSQNRPQRSNPKIYSEEQLDLLRAIKEKEKEEDDALEEGDLMRDKGNPADEIEDGMSGEVHEKLDEFFGKDENLNENEAFLKTFLLDKMWVRKDRDERPLGGDIDVSEDEDAIERQENYEARYNFRYQEAGQEDRVLGHSRLIKDSVRKKENVRKAKRKTKDERIAQVKAEREEELKHLKNLKKKEIQGKLEKIRAIAGIGDGAACKLNEEDLEEDFDPEEYDRKMRETFDLGYYDAQDADPGFEMDDDDHDMEKPDFDKEDELLGLPKDWDANGSKDGFAAARERALSKKEEEEEEEEPTEQQSKRKKKRKISLKEKVELDKEFEEYYKLDYEDAIGDLKTRFKYKPVQANRYGLQPEEILLAKDKDLNQYVSMKKLAPYRPDEWQVTYHQRKKKDLILQGEISKTQKAIKKQVVEEEQNPEVEKKTDTESKRSKKRRRQEELKIPPSRRMAYGITPPSKNHKKH